MEIREKSWIGRIDVCGSAHKVGRGTLQGIAWKFVRSTRVQRRVEGLSDEWTSHGFADLLRELLIGRSCIVTWIRNDRYERSVLRFGIVSRS